MILWLGAMLWLNAFTQRADAIQVRDVSLQETVLINLADALAVERQLMYALVNTETITTSDTEKYQQLIWETTHFIRAENIQSLLSREGGFGNTNAHDHARHGQMHNDVMTNNDHTGKLAGQQPQQANNNSTPDSIIKKISTLRKQHEQFYSQLEMPLNKRNPNLGMSKFHQYSSIIESIDRLRRTIYIAPRESKREFFIHSKLNDIFWNLRENTLQSIALTNGIAQNSHSSGQLPNIQHHSEMLMELNIRIDIAWKELIRISSSSDNTDLVARFQTDYNWYSDNYQRFSEHFSAASRYNEINSKDLELWLNSAEALLDYTDNLRDQTASTTFQSIRHIKHLATLKLLLTTVAVVLTLIMAIISLWIYQKLNKHAHRDSLTHLANRRTFLLNAKNEINIAITSSSSLSLIIIDLDKFKHINDTMGHTAGDTLLLSVANRLSEIAMTNYSLARLGGDEFALLIPENAVESATAIAQRIRTTLLTPFIIDNKPQEIGCSIGIAEFPKDADTYDKLIKSADLAMYCAKKAGTNKIVNFDFHIDHKLSHKAQTAIDLKQAIVDGQFKLYYQPQFNLGSSKVESVEALIRWCHPERGLVPPDEFITIAEENGLMHLIGDWVINEACQQASQWLHNDGINLRVAVNISADHFFAAGFLQTITQGLSRHDLPPTCLELEVTESVAMHDIEEVIDSLKNLRNLSVNIALDDFGTGYSSLSYLKDLPLDTLKIDKTFVQKLLQGDKRHDAITETIISLAKSLDLEIVAEGVETVDQLNHVTKLAVSVVQGYYYSKPVPASELIGVVQRLNLDYGDQKVA